MSTPLPTIPPEPTADSTPEQWAHYRWAVSLHVTAEQTEAIRAETAQVVLLTAATQATAAIGQQVLNQPQPTNGFDQDFVKWLVLTVLRLPPEPVDG